MKLAKLIRSGSTDLGGPFAMLALSIVVYLTAAIPALVRETPTVDEFAHVPAGLSYWTRGDFELYSKNPPLGKLWLTLPTFAETALTPSPRVVIPDRQEDALGWGPWLYGTRFERANSPEAYFGVFKQARFMNVLLALSTAALIFAWARTMMREWLAVLSASGFLLSPTVIAHSHLATVDIACAFTVTLFSFVLSRLFRPRSFGKWLALAALSGALLGVALATKFTAIFLLPWFFAGLALAAWQIRRPKNLLLATPLAFAMTFFVVGAAYGFQSLFRPLSSDKISSRTLSQLTAFVPRGLPVPLPKTFVTGFDAQAQDAETGEFGSYLLGQWSNDGWWYYNPLAFLLKEPLITFAVILIALSALAMRLPPTLKKFGLHALWHSRLFPVVMPLLAIGLPLSLASHLQIGVRYLLPFYPFFFIAMGCGLECAMPWMRNARYRVVVITGIVGLWVIAALSAAEDPLSYFNQAALTVADKEDLLIDSNLDWGQDLYRLRDLNKRNGGSIGLLYFGHVNPKDYGIDFYIPQPGARGLVAVSVNFLKGSSYIAPTPDFTFVEVRRGQLDWLKGLKPVAKEGSIYVFDLNPGR